jgi:putative Mn2+ efflux pump MntP
MLHLMLLALALSWDSFFVGFLGGCLDLNRPSRRYLPMLFGLCDGAAVGIGLLAAGAPLVRLGQISEGTWILPWLLLVLLVLQRFASRRSREITWPIYLVPVLLSLDNFMAGPAFARLEISPILCVASATGVSALLFVAGAMCGRETRSHIHFVQARRQLARQQAPCEPRRDVAIQVRYIATELKRSRHTMESLTGDR